MLSTPASIGLILLRVPVVQLLLQRGAFTERSTELVAWALLWYAAGLVGHSVMEVLARTFYALHDTKTPVMVGVFAMILNVIFSFSFSALFQEIGWMPHGGLALANSLATALETFILLILIRRRLGGIQDHQVLQGFGSAILGVTAMSLAIWFWMGLMGNGSPWQVVAGGILIGSAAYVMILTILRVPETRQLLQLGLARFGIKTKE